MHNGKKAHFPFARFHGVSEMLIISERLPLVVGATISPETEIGLMVVVLMGEIIETHINVPVVSAVSVCTILQQI